MPTKPPAIHAVAALVLAAAATPALAQDTATNVVLVHGALLDGSGWRDVHDILVADGLAVSVVQMPLTSLADDVASTRRVLDRLEGPVVLVGHSYGGVVITEAGADPDVVSLVYVAALQPDVGESLMEVSQLVPPTSEPPAMIASDDGFAILEPADFRAAIAADLPTEVTDFLAASQTFTSYAAFTGEVTAAAWRDKPSHAVIPTQDLTVSADLQRLMSERSGAAVTEVEASHLVQMSQPEAVAAVIAAAATALD